jgi:hypothetical protein
MRKLSSNRNCQYELFQKYGYWHFQFELANHKAAGNDHEQSYCETSTAVQTPTARNFEASGKYWKLIKLKSKLRGLNPRANYTERATAACRRS